MKVFALLGLILPCLASPSESLRSFGVAVKSLKLAAENETTVFEYSLSLGTASGAVTQQWHAGNNNMNLRVRIFVDGEANASVEYPVALAHGAGPVQVTLGAAEGRTSRSSLAGQSDTGFWNNFLVIFQSSVRVTLTSAEQMPIWYMVRDLENGPLVAAGVSLPPTARLQTQPSCD